MSLTEVDLPQPRAIEVSRDEALGEIRSARERLAKKDGAVFVGINNKGLHSDGTRVLRAVQQVWHASSFDWCDH